MNVPPSPFLGAVPENYLFSEVAKRVAAAKNRQPHKQTISLGIGDVTQGSVVPRLRTGERLYVLENRGLGALRAAGSEHLPR